MDYGGENEPTPIGDPEPAVMPSGEPMPEPQPEPEREDMASGGKNTVDDGNNEYPVPFARFAATLRGSHDEVFTRHMQIKFRHQNHTPSHWRELLAAEMDAPAHPGP